MTARWGEIEVASRKSNTWDPAADEKHNAPTIQWPHDVLWRLFHDLAEADDAAHLYATLTPQQAKAVNQLVWQEMSWDQIVDVAERQLYFRYLDGGGVWAAVDQDSIGPDAVEKLRAYFRWCRDSRAKFLAGAVSLDGITTPEALADHVGGFLERLNRIPNVTLPLAPYVLHDVFDALFRIHEQHRHIHDIPQPPACPTWLKSWDESGSLAQAFRGEVPTGLTTLAVRSEIARVLDWCEAASRIVDGTTRREGTTDATSPREQRDKWIYDECMKNTAYKTVAARLKKRRPKKWPMIESLTGIKAAADRYADRHGLPRPHARKSGRRPSS